MQSFINPVGYLFFLTHVENKRRKILSKFELNRNDTIVLQISISSKTFYVISFKLRRRFNYYLFNIFLAYYFIC